MITTTFPAQLQSFFTNRLCNQIQASPNTIASYRDTFRLLLKFASKKLNKSPTKLEIEDIDSILICDFLAHVETDRGNSTHSRNTRLASIRSFYRFVAMNEPQHAQHCQRILAIPSKRYVKRSIDYLNRAEIEALISAPVASTWIGRRDRAILMVALQTGLRVSELIHLECQDIVLGTGAHVKCEGKGRKQRCTPLRKDTIMILKIWLKERAGANGDPVFITNRGDKLSRDAMEHIVKKYALAASIKCPSFANKKVSPHVLRHSAAMELLQNGVDLAVIALWLGHESVETTQIYIHADMRIKEKALANVSPTKSHPGRYKPDDTLLSFLESL